MTQGPKDKKSPAAKASKKRGWLAYFCFMVVLLFALLLGGFFTFVRHIDNLSTPSLPSIPKADGIVVWTGKGGGRLETSGKLLMEEKGERLLVSGVNENITSEQITALLAIAQDKADCCVDLDYAAANTIGNARETAIWAKALDYDHIILVTSAYHMPRAQVEISRAAGRIRITAFPVKQDAAGPWYKSAPRAKRLIQEYIKLLISYARGRSTAAPQAAPNLPELEKSKS